MAVNSITITRPDDWHLHLRDGAMLHTVLPFTAKVFARAIVMPNLTPPVTTKLMAKEYRERILAALPAGLKFTPLMTLYLTDSVDAADVKAGFAEGIYTAAKLYPAHATTNSAHGVTELKNIYPALEAMQEIGMPLLVHGEVTDPEIDIFDREKVFLDKVMPGLLRDFPKLKIVLEHATTKEAVDFVRAHSKKHALGCTITPQHLHINRNAIFKGGIRPHFYCLPVAKREEHRLALIKAATSGEACFFLGTDSAPHTKNAKESGCGCAGIFCAPQAMELYAEIFDEQNALPQLEAFASLNGAKFYGLAMNEEKITLVKEEAAELKDIAVAGSDAVVPFALGKARRWRLA